MPITINRTVRGIHNETLEMEDDVARSTQLVDLFGPDFDVVSENGFLRHCDRQLSVAAFDRGFSVYDAAQQLLEEGEAVSGATFEADRTIAATGARRAAGG